MVRDIGVVQKIHFLFCPRSAPSSPGWWKDDWKCVLKRRNTSGVDPLLSRANDQVSWTQAALQGGAPGGTRCKNLQKPKSCALRAQVTMSLPEAGSQSENPPILQNGRIYNGSKRAHILSLFARNHAPRARQWSARARRRRTEKRAFPTSPPWFEI